MSSKKKDRAKKRKSSSNSKTVKGDRIIQLCPADAAKGVRKVGWQILLLGFSDDGKVTVDKDEDPIIELEDVACWALVKLEREQLQIIVPCVATESGTIEAVDTGAENYVGVVPPNYTDDQVDDMARDYMTELLESGKFDTVIEETESDEEDSDG